ncbi:MAG: tyrosine--tRNA ligase [Caldisericia bacterium]|nr:tyrosine--tRNA ligase [Caldisericia bacterium]
MTKKELSLIGKNTVDFIGEEDLLKRTESGEKLRIKYGADPSAPDLHLGHYVPISKMKQFQDMGHKIIFIIGDFTAKIGDPTGRSKVRKALTDEEIKTNSKTYFQQVGKVLDLSKTEIRYNSEWCSKLTMDELLKMMSHFTISQILERDDFSKRFKTQTPIFLHEFMYPLMQAYDSVAIKADLELGGSDQLFNFLLARELQGYFHQKPQAILTMPLLVGTDGEAKMSKSLGNYIGLTENSISMFGKLMSIPDPLLITYYRLILHLSDLELETIQTEIDMGKNPMEFKMDLATKITSKFTNEKEAIEAKDHFVTVHRKKSIPTDIPEFRISDSEKVRVSDFITDQKMTPTKSEAKRIIKGGGVSINSIKITDPFEEIQFKNGDIVKVGKRKFLKIVC